MAKETAKPSEEPGSTRGMSDFLRDFATADPRSLGLFRILFGVFLLVDLYRRLPDVSLFYTNDGMLPNHSALFRPMSGHLFSIFHPFSSRGEVLAAFAVTAIVYLVYTIGWRTKIFQIATLVLVTSLHSRNIMLENGGDVVANILALWTVFLPLGRRFSLDAMLASLRARDEHGPDELNDRAAPLPDTRPVVSLAYAALVLNLVVIYYFNAIHKDGGIWRAGETVHYVLWADRLVNPFGVWLRDYMPMGVVKVLTYGTLVLELTVVVMLTLTSIVWLRASRRVAALTIIAIHAGFQTVGHFGLFSFIMMLHAPLLLGAEDWEALARRMKAKLPSRKVFYDASCGICHQISRVAKRLDHLGKMTFIPNDREDLLPKGVTKETVGSTIVVSNGKGDVFWTRGTALSQGLRALPFGVGLAKLMALPGFAQLNDAIYDFVAARRVAWSVGLGYAACGLPRKDEDARPVEIVAERPHLFPRARSFLYNAAIFVFIVGLGNQAIAENRKVPTQVKQLVGHPQWSQAIAQYGRFFQGWAMFAPVPPTDDGIMVVDAVTVDGRHVDPLAMGGPPSFELPDAKHGNLMTQFWYELHDRMRRDNNAKYREALRDYFLSWQRIEHRPANDRIVSFELYWVSRATQPPGSKERPDTRKQKLMEHKAEPEAAPAPGPARPPPVLPKAP